MRDRLVDADRAAELLAGRDVLDRELERPARRRRRPPSPAARAAVRAGRAGDCDRRAAARPRRRPRRRAGASRPWSRARFARSPRARRSRRRRRPPRGWRRRARLSARRARASSSPRRRRPRPAASGGQRGEERGRRRPRARRRARGRAPRRSPPPRGSRARRRPAPPGRRRRSSRAPRAAPRSAPGSRSRNARAARRSSSCSGVKAASISGTSAGRARARRRCCGGSPRCRPRSCCRGCGAAGAASSRRGGAPSPSSCASGPSSSSASFVSRWFASDHCSFAIDPSGPGMPVLTSAVSERRFVNRSACSSIHSRAMRSRWSGVAPRSLARATSLRTEISSAAWSAKPSVPRSCSSVVIATCQPPPISPSTFSCGTSTSVKKISLNSDSPVIWRSGRTSTPGRLHVDDQVGEPVVALRVGVAAGEEDAEVGDVRERRPDLLAVDDEVAVLERARSCGRPRGRSPRPAPRSPGTRSPRRSGSSPGAAASAPRCRGP